MKIRKPRESGRSGVGLITKDQAPPNRLLLPRGWQHQIPHSYPPTRTLKREREGALNGGYGDGVWVVVLVVMLGGGGEGCCGDWLVEGEVECGLPSHHSQHVSPITTTLTTPPYPSMVTPTHHHHQYHHHNTQHYLIKVATLHDMYMCMYMYISVFIHSSIHLFASLFIYSFIHLFHELIMY